MKNTSFIVIVLLIVQVIVLRSCKSKDKSVSVPQVVIHTGKSVDAASEEVNTTEDKRLLIKNDWLNGLSSNVPAGMKAGNDR